MQLGDWINAAISLVIGVLLGSAADGLVQTATTAFWPVAVITPLLFAGAFLVMWVSDKLLDRLFPIGVRPATKPQTSGRAPLPRLLSLPVGVVLGLVLARLGLDDTILGMLP
jgi:hypothetical protein